MRRSLLVGVAASIIGLLLLSHNGSAAPSRVNWKFTLDFAIQASQAPFIVALDKGYYAREGINVTIDRGLGSADALTKVASGAYDLGYADLSAMVEFNVRNPGRELISVAVVQNVASWCVATLRRENIARPQDLTGKKLGAPPGDGARRLFPVFAKAIGIYPESVEWVNMDFALREPSLIRGSVNAISGGFWALVLNLKTAGVNPNDIVVFNYFEHGAPLYGNAIMTTPALLKQQPEAVRGFLRAFTKGLQDTFNNPAEAVAIIKKYDPLLNENVERERLGLTARYHLTPEVKANGFGVVKPDRLARSIDAVAEAFQLPSKPKWFDVFTDKYLPPQKDRILPDAIK